MPSTTWPTNVFTRPGLARIALACAVVAASLWDFRLDSLRIFDLAAFALLCTFFALDIDVGRDWLAKRIYIVPLIALVVVYAGVGYLNFHHRSSLAIGFLAILCLQFSGYRNVSWIFRVFRWIIYLNAAVLVVQFAVYKLFGILLDPQNLFGVHSRVFYDGELRPAGLFQEPNSCALNIFIVATVALLPKRDRVLAMVAAGSILMTVSLWGIVAAFVLVALSEWNADVSFAIKIGMTLALWAALFVAFNGYLWIGKAPKAQMPALYARVLNISKDTSATDRYGAIIGKTPNSRIGKTPNSRAAEPSPERSSRRFVWWLGNGLSTSAFIDTISANGLSFLWFCFGPAGLLLLAAAFGWALAGLTLQDKLYVVAAVALTFTTYPLMTYAIFWLWLPVLFMLARQRSEAPWRNLAQPLAAGGQA